jgi:hypothetical protein
MSNFIRQFHRWTSVAFVLTVIATTVSIAQKGPMWMSYVPLLPLALLAITGSYMFFLPYVARWRSGRQAAAA